MDANGFGDSLPWPAKTERIVNGSVSPYLAVHGSFWELRTLIGRYRKIIGTGRNHWTIPNSFLSELLNFTNIATLQCLWLRTIPRLPHIDTRKIKDHALLFPLDTGTTARGAAAGKEGLPKFQIGDGMNHYDAITCMLTIKAGCTYYSDSRGGELNVYRLSFWIGFLGGFKQMRTCANELTE